MAIERGMAAEVEGDTSSGGSEEETETDEGVDLEQFLSRRHYKEIKDNIIDMINENSEWSFSGGLSITVDLERTIESDGDGETIIADVYTLQSAVKNELIVARETMVGDLLTWAKHTDVSGVSEVDPNLITALNVAGEDMLLVGKLALIAKTHGAREVAITDMIMRGKFGLDVVSRRVLFEPGEQADIPFPQSRPVVAGNRRRRIPRQEREGMAENPGSYPLRRNPSPTPTRSEQTALDYGLERLERLREDLGGDRLADMP